MHVHVCCLFATVFNEFCVVSIIFIINNKESVCFFGLSCRYGKKMGHVRLFTSDSRSSSLRGET